MQFLHKNAKTIKIDSKKVRKQRKMRMERKKMVEYGQLQKMFAAMSAKFPVHQ